MTTEDGKRTTHKLRSNNKNTCTEFLRCPCTWVIGYFNFGMVVTKKWTQMAYQALSFDPYPHVVDTVWILAAKSEAAKVAVRLKLREVHRPW